MPFITLVPPREATGELADAYQYLKVVGGDRGLIPKVVHLFSPRPASVRRMIRGWELIMWAGEEPRPVRELVAASVSRLNDCHY